MNEKLGELMRSRKSVQRREEGREERGGGKARPELEETASPRSGRCDGASKRGLEGEAGEAGQPGGAEKEVFQEGVTICITCCDGPGERSTGMGRGTGRPQGYR